MVSLQFELNAASGRSSVSVEIRDLVIAGWAGRDKEAMEHHIQELEAIGVPRPATTPTYYRVAASRLTHLGAVQDSGPNSSGEAEILLISSGGKTYVGLASDHTDRKAETVGISLSKQACDKPVGPTLWLFEDVIAHWDALQLRSFIVDAGQRVLYQQGSVSALLAPADLIAGYREGLQSLPDGTAMLCGTMPAIGGIRSSSRFECELDDPVLGRKMSLHYEVEALPVMG